MAAEDPPHSADEQADERDAAAAERDAAWPVDALDHAAMDRLHAADDRAHAREDRERAADDRLHLNRAVENRTIIGQAQGLLMARLGIGAEAAFALLVRQSQHSNVRLADVAAGIVGDHERSIATSG